MTFRSPQICYSPDGEGGGSAPASSSEPAANAGAAAAAPSPTPAPAAPQTVTTHSATPSLKDAQLPQTDVFEALGIMDDEGPPEPTPQPSPVAEPAVPQQGVPPPTPQAPPQAAPAQPAATQQPEPTQAPAPAGESGEARSSAAPQVFAPFSRESLTELEKPENRDALIGAMADQFVLSDEDLNGLATDAAPVLRRIAARVLYASSLHTLKQLGEFADRYLPQRMSEFQESQRRAEGHNNRFQRMWPGLSDPKYNDAIASVAATVKKIPGITQEGVYRTVGRTVAAMYGLSINPVEVQAAVPQGAPAPVLRQQAPFAPAAPGGGSGIPSSQSNGSGSPWDGLGMDYD